MKTIITGALAIALSIGAANAQTTSTQDKADHGKHMHHKGGGFDQLNLTDAQKAQFKTLMESQRKEMEALKSQSLTEEQSREKRKAIMESYRPKMRAILTPEQQTKFDAMKKDHEGKRDKMKGKKDDSNAERKPFDGRKLREQIKLSSDQEAQLAKLRKDLKPKFEGVKADQSLTEDQKRSAYRDLMKTQQEQMKSILTADQLEKLKSMHSDRSKHVK